MSSEYVDAWLADPYALDAAVIPPAPAVRITGPAVAYEAA